MKVEEKFNERLKKDLGFEIRNIKRVYPGYWQRAAGAWSWTGDKVIDGVKSGSMNIGSCQSIGECLKSNTPLVLWKDEIIAND